MYFLIWLAFQSANLVLIFPDFFQVILLVIYAQLIQWSEQDFETKIQMMFSFPLP